MIGIAITYSGNTPMELKRNMMHIMRAVYSDMAATYRREVLPGHFQTTARQEYNYQPRSGEPGRTGKDFWRTYTGVKLRKRNTRSPLTYSGEMKRRAMNMYSTATTRGVRITVPGPSYMMITTRRDGYVIDKAEELKSISTQDVQVITKAANDSFKRRVEAVHGTGGTVFRTRRVTL